MLRTAVLAALLPALVPTQADAQPVHTCSVERVIDGDTFVCEGGERVRLLLVDTPEMDQRPLGRLARSFLVGLMPPGTDVTLRLDVRERDRYGRLLAYVELPDGRQVNRVLARRGFAQSMTIPPNVARAEAIRAAVDSARAEGEGLWGMEELGGEEEEASAGACAASYPDVCIPPPPPDLDCRDVPQRRFRVVGPDPHRFDGDGDGVGCESG